MNREEIGEKLRVLREQVGLSLTEAAKRLGFSNYQTLSKIESGEREVRAAELSKFAKEYYFDFNQFLFGGPIEQKQAAFLWRRQPEADVKQNIESRLMKKGRHFHILEKLLYEDKKRSFEWPAVSIEDIRSNNNVDDLAEDVRKRLDLGGRPAVSLKVSLEQELKVKIIYQSLQDIGSAASMIHDEYGAIIVINQDEAPWRQNYDMAHELFHLITWNVVPQENLQDSQTLEEIEKKANRFASTLLLPTDEVRKQLHSKLEKQKKIDAADLVDIAIEFDVSREALIYRLVNLGMLKWENAQKYCNDEYLKDLDRFKRHDHCEKININDRFNRLAIRCLRKGLISKGKFAEMIEIDRSDIDLFVDDNYATLSNEDETIEIMAP